VTREEACKYSVQMQYLKKIFLIYAWLNPRMWTWWIQRADGIVKKRNREF
jgi:hypothetical protein